MTQADLEQISLLPLEIRMHTESLKKLEHEYDDAHWPEKVQELREIIEGMRRRCVAQLEGLERWLADIPDPYIRQILTLRYVEGLPWKEVAARIGGDNSSALMRMTASRYLKRESA